MQKQKVLAWKLSGLHQHASMKAISAFIPGAQVKIAKREDSDAAKVPAFRVRA